MIIEITGSVSVDDRTQRYVEKAIGSLDRYLAKTSRQSTRAEVILRRVNRAHGNKYEAEVHMHIADTVISAKDSTLNILAALDIVRAKLVIELKKSPDQRLP